VDGTAQACISRCQRAQSIFLVQRVHYDPAANHGSAVRNQVD
jgi:hypothetical protein